MSYVISATCGARLENSHCAQLLCRSGKNGVVSLHTLTGLGTTVKYFVIHLKVRSPLQIGKSFLFCGFECCFY